MAKSHAAILRERNRVEQAWKRERRRTAAFMRRHTGIPVMAKDEIRLEAARQALSWALGENAMSISRIDAASERDRAKRLRKVRRTRR